MAEKLIWKDNVGQIFLSDQEECFWMFPEDFFYDKRLCIMSRWFYRPNEHWRFVKVPGKLSSNYVTLYVWRDGSGELCNSDYCFHFSLKTLDGYRTPIVSSCRNMNTKLRNEFMDGVEFVDFCCLSDLTGYTVSRCGLIKLFFKIHRELCAPVTIPRIEENVKEIKSEDEFEEDEETEEHEIKGLERLAANLKQLFLNGQNSDTVLEIDGREFQVHKAILASRSPVFASMFQHDTTEKKSGVIDIPDCTAESFEAFLLYMYTGIADTISPNNVFNLYYAADKYRVDDLKEECVEYLINNLSVETFCDVIALSLRHGESKLQKEATRFFQANVKKIIKTVQWQKYLSDNTTHANELFIKALNA